jgi:hypothetical protein
MPMAEEVHVSVEEAIAQRKQPKPYDLASLSLARAMNLSLRQHVQWKGGSSSRKSSSLERMKLLGFVVLEGHLRLTAYLLADEFSPAEVRAIVGFSNNLTRWMGKGDS